VEWHDQRFIRIGLCAHNSLNKKGILLFMVTVSAGPFVAGVFCLFQGCWPVLPFAGLELLLVWLALRASLKRGEQRQSISISQDFVTISSQLSVSQAKTRFPRHWTRVKLCGSRFGYYPTRLVFESSGRVCEVGHFLTEQERRALALRLQRLVGNMNDSPALY